MNLLSEAVHVHDRLKKDVGDVLVKEGKKVDGERNDLVTLEEYYGERVPVYERYSEK